MNKKILGTILILLSNTIFGMESNKNQFNILSELNIHHPTLLMNVIEEGIKSELNSHSNPIKAILSAAKYLNNITSISKPWHTKKEDLTEKLKQWAKEKFAPEYAKLTETEATQEMSRIIKGRDLSKDLIIKLIIAGANPNIEYNPKGIPGFKQNLLSIVISMFENIDSVKFLIFYNADVNYNTPWKTVSNLEDPKLRREIAKLLISAKADVNKPNNKGLLPLDIAIADENMDLVRILIEHGARIDIKNQEEQTPLDLAMTLGNQYILNLLTQKIQ